VALSVGKLRDLNLTCPEKLKKIQYSDMDFKIVEIEIAINT